MPLSRKVRFRDEGQVGSVAQAKSAASGPQFGQ